MKWLRRFWASEEEFFEAFFWNVVLALVAVAIAIVGDQFLW